MILLEKQNKIPRASILEKEIEADVLDERYLEQNPSEFRRFWYKKFPIHISQIIESLLIRKEYDVILSQSEKVGFPLALLMRIFGMKTPHVVIISRITSVSERQSRRKIWFFKRIKNSVSKFLIWSTVQRQLAIEKLGVDPSKIILVKRGTDQKFWKPEYPETNSICSVGMEARDYLTFIEALRPLNIPCHIAAGIARGEMFDTVKKLYQVKDLPEWITVGKKGAIELRELYAKSRFVVVPLIESDSDNGLTTILEAMAMGKAVICSRTEGQVGLLEDGVSGIFVPQGDVNALRGAILELWNDPEKCIEMGKRGREFIEQNHNLEQFVDMVSKEVKSAVPNLVLEEELEFDQVKV